jgi:hypothetical protein
MDLTDEDEDVNDLIRIICDNSPFLREMLLLAIRSCSTLSCNEFEYNIRELNYRILDIARLQ